MAEMGDCRLSFGDIAVRLWSAFVHRNLSRLLHLIRKKLIIRISNISGADPSVMRPAGCAFAFPEGRRFLPAKLGRSVEFPFFFVAERSRMRFASRGAHGNAN
jgi:hypothetical protein